MNREIKFRLWHEGSKQMFYNTASSMNILIGLGGEIKDIYLKADITGEMKISQFTGLKDKNGKEIYEGDIILKDSSFKGAIVWEKINCRFKIKREKSYDFFLSEGTYCEVIGNIYENPELLKS